MKKLFKTLMVCLLCLGIVGCSNDSKKNTTEKNNEEIKEENTISIEDYPDLKKHGDDVANLINSRMSTDFSYKEIKSNDNWGHIVYTSTSTPITIEIDFTISDKVFKGVTVDNNDLDKINDGFRTIPVALMDYEPLQLTQDEKDSTILLLADVNTNEIANDRVHILDDKLLNIFSISLK